MIIEFHNLNKNIDKIENFITENKDLKLIHIHANNFKEVDINGNPNDVELTFVNINKIYVPDEKSKKAFFEIIFATIIKVEEDVENKKDLEKIILCDVQIEIYPELEKIFLNLLDVSGYPGIKFDKKIDFKELYNQRFN